MNPRPYSPRATLISALVVGGLIVWTYFMPAPTTPHVALEGETMGTYYRIKLKDAHASKKTISELQSFIQDELETFNRLFSTYLPDAVINVVNRAPAHQPILTQKDSPRFYAMFSLAHYFYTQTDGLFDPSVNPLVSQWGFGPDQISTNNTNLSHRVLGFDQFHWEEGALTKEQDGLALDFNAVAKGVMVDRLFEALYSRGYTNIMVDIGGELRAMGLNMQDVPWRIGISEPLPLADGVYQDNIVQANPEISIATSGDYQQRRIGSDGSVLSHIIDPRTGKPAHSRLTSVSVIATNCATADAYATALFVMGLEEGITWVEKQPQVDAFFIAVDEQGKLISRASSGFQKWRFKPEL